MTGQLLRSSLMSLLVLCGGSAHLTGEDLNIVLGPKTPEQTLLLQKAVILDHITGAREVYPEFGSLTDRTAKDLLLGYGIKGAKGDNRRGRLKIFPNLGTRDQPRYEQGDWLDETIPSARIPVGMKPSHLSLRSWRTLTVTGFSICSPVLIVAHPFIFIFCVVAARVVSMSCKRSNFSPGRKILR